MLKLSIIIIASINNIKVFFCRELEFLAFHYVLGLLDLVLYDFLIMFNVLVDFQNDGAE